jgi:hypothetical protein
VSAVVPEHLDADGADLADPARGDQVAGDLDGGDVPIVEADGGRHAGGRDGLGDLERLGQVPSRRLLDPEVLARLGGGDGHVPVGEVRAGDTNEVDVVAADQLVPVRGGEGDAEDVARVAEPAVVRGVGDGDQPRGGAQVRVVLPDPGQGLGVDLPHPAEADDADVDVLSHGCTCCLSEGVTGRV